MEWSRGRKRGWLPVTIGVTTAFLRFSASSHKPYIPSHPLGGERSHQYLVAFASGHLRPSEGWKRTKYFQLVWGGVTPNPQSQNGSLERLLNDQVLSQHRGLGWTKGLLGQYFTRRKRYYGTWDILRISKSFPQTLRIVLRIDFWEWRKKETGREREREGKLSVKKPFEWERPSAFLSKTMW